MYVIHAGMVCVTYGGLRSLSVPCICFKVVMGYFYICTVNVSHVILLKAIANCLQELHNTNV